MYHHHQHQGKNIHSSSSSRMPISAERHMFLQTGNSSGDSGLVLSTDAKPRLKWTADPQSMQVQQLEKDFLQAVLEKAQETLGRQNLGMTGLEAAKVQISELVSKVSSQCLISTFSELKELQGFCPQQTQNNQPTDRSMDSCLTSFLSNSLGKSSERRGYAAERSPGDLSMSIGLERETENDGNGMYPERLMIGREPTGGFQHRNTTSKPESIKPLEEKVHQECRLPYFAGSKLDLNIREENDASMSCKQLDLNGFSWS